MDRRQFMQLTAAVAAQAVIPISITPASTPMSPFSKAYLKELQESDGQTFTEEALRHDRYDAMLPIGGKTGRWK